MTTPPAPFASEALDNLAKIIADTYSNSEISRLFQRSGCADIEYVNSTKWRLVSEVFHKLQVRSGGSPNGVLKVIKCFCSPQSYVGQRDTFDGVLASVNEVLVFYGLRMEDDGRLLKTGESATTVRRTKSDDEMAFDSRSFHPKVIDHGRRRFSEGNYFHAVFECCKAFDAAVKGNSEIRKTGDALMGEALSLDGPIKLNSQRSQSEQDEQRGIMFLCKGLMSAVRNPQAHEPEMNWKMTQQDALDVLALVSFLFRKLEGAVVFNGATAGGVKVKLCVLLWNLFGRQINCPMAGSGHGCRTYAAL